MTRLHANIGLLAVGFLWGTTFVVMKDALAELPPMQLLFYRFSLASLLLFFMFRRKIKASSSKKITKGIWVGLALGLGYITQTIGLQTTPSGQTAVITGLNLVFLPFLSFSILGQKMNRFHFISILISFFGFCLLTGIDFEEWKWTIGSGWVLLCAFLFALQIIGVTQVSSELEPWTLTFIQILVTALLSGVGSLIYEQWVWDMTARTSAGILGTALFATVMALALQSHCQKYTDPLIAGLLMGSEYFFAVIFGVIVANESYHWIQWSGVIFMVAAMLLSEWATQRKAMM